MTMRIRLAQETDAAAIARIYAPYVTDTPASFEIAPPQAEDMARRIRAVGAAFPFLVAVAAEEVAGYAYASRHMERAAYQWNAVLSVYVAGAFQRRGIGSSLCETLIGILRLQGMHNAYGNVTLPNPGSEGLLRNLGFRPLGVFTKTGYKCGQWHDVGWFEKRIGPCAVDPPPPLDMGRTDAAAVRRALDAGSAALNRSR